MCWNSQLEGVNSSVGFPFELCVGGQVATLGSMTWDWGLLVTGLPLCLATRAANIFPLSKAANLRRKLPLPQNLQARLCTCLCPPTAQHCTRCLESEAPVELIKHAVIFQIVARAPGGSECQAVGRRMRMLCASNALPCQSIGTVA